MIDLWSRLGGRRLLVPRRASTSGVAGAALFCVAAVLIAWAGHALVQAPSDPAAAASAPPGGSGVSQPGTPDGGQVRERGADGDLRGGADDRREGAAGSTTAAAPNVAGRSPIRGIELAGAAPEPQRIVIPAMGVDQDLTELAVIGTALQVPEDYSDIGWWSGAPTPGEQEAGDFVVVGHVDSRTGPAVFYGLAGLRDGDRVRVTRTDGSVMVFAVRKTGLYGSDDFPSNRVYGSHGRPSLRLLTCGGSFDPGNGRYSQNVVVFAEILNRLSRDEVQQRQGADAQREGSDR